MLALLLILTLNSCGNKAENLATDSITDYLPLKVGKYITYRLDSLVFTNFGRNTETHAYSLKYQIADTTTDNLGQKIFVVNEFLRDTASLTPWRSIGSSYITPYNNHIDWTEDNLRVTKLFLPMRENFQWKGNIAIPSNPYNNNYPFSNDDNIQDWNFYYSGSANSFAYSNQYYQNVYTVEQRNEILNDPITLPAAYASKTRAVEHYAKGIGLVHKQFELWEYQPNTGGSGGGYKVGFGVTCWMIDHN